jgi:hypothetical protein
MGHPWMLYILISTGTTDTAHNTEAFDTLSGAPAPYLMSWITKMQMMRQLEATRTMDRQICR